MVKFASGISTKTRYEIERKNVFWLVVFDLPDEIREKKSLLEVADICGDFVMGFYADPIPGDIIEYRGHLWRVTERVFKPNKYRSRDQRRVAKLLVDYIGAVPENAIAVTDQ